ncbi:unnamed protein product [Aphanomyces euteiches]
MAGSAAPGSESNVILSLSSVKFPAHTDSFRIRISAKRDDVPISIWMSSKQSNLQWETEVTCFDDHKPLTAGYSLPSPMVLSSLKVLPSYRNLKLAECID